MLQCDADTTQQSKIADAKQEMDYWYCSVLQRVTACCSVLQCVAVCCSVLQCVAVCCSVL